MCQLAIALIAIRTNVVAFFGVGSVGGCQKESDGADLITDGTMAFLHISTKAAIGTDKTSVDFTKQVFAIGAAVVPA